jgi:small subunit ribosomal protein S9
MADDVLPEDVAADSGVIAPELAVEVPGVADAPVAADGPVAEAAGESSTGSVVPSLDIGSQSSADAPVAVAVQHVVRGRTLPDGTVVATGRRKTSVARVRVKKGTGKITINDREFAEYFPVERYRLEVEAPLKLCGVRGEVDVWVRANGGGLTGQAGAIVLGLARALHAMRAELHPILAEHSFLTRDDRMVERKKYGHKKARRSFQFSKR